MCLRTSLSFWLHTLGPRARRPTATPAQQCEKCPSLRRTRQQLSRSISCSMCVCYQPCVQMASVTILMRWNSNLNEIMQNAVRPDTCDRPNLISIFSFQSRAAKLPYHIFREETYISWIVSTLFLQVPNLLKDLKRLSGWPLASLQHQLPGNRANRRACPLWDMMSLNFILLKNMKTLSRERNH